VLLRDVCCRVIAAVPTPSLKAGTAKDGKSLAAGLELLRSKYCACPDPGPDMKQRKYQHLVGHTKKVSIYHPPQASSDSSSV
jgi:hypothetical protein